MRKAVDIITMPLAENSEFNLAYHVSSHTTRDWGKLLQPTQVMRDFAAESKKSHAQPSNDRLLSINAGLSQKLVSTPRTQ
jgi:hypothetical protein